MTITVSANYQTEHDKLRRTPAYLVSFAGVDDVFGTHHLIGETSDIDDTVDIDFTLDADKTYDIDAGLEAFLNDLFDGAAFVETLPHMQLPRGIAAQIEPDKGRSSIGSVTFVLTDIDGAITALIGAGIGGRVATLKAGFDNILESDFATFFTGIVSSYKMTADLTGYEITVRDPQTLTNKQVFECAATKTTALLTSLTTDTYTHYLDVLGQRYVVTNALDAAAMTTAADASFGAGNWSFYAASVASIGSTITADDTQFFLSAGYVMLDSEIIQYTGKTATTFTGLTRGVLGTTAASHAIGTSAKELLRIGPAHPCDIIQSVLTNMNKTGLSIDSALVDSATFDAVKTSIGAAYEMEFRITSRVNGKAFLEDQLYPIIACYPVTTGTGLLSIREFGEPASVDSVATIDHDSIVADEDGRPILEWDGNFAKLINKVTYYYDYNPITGEYDSHFEDSNDESIDTYGEAPLTIFANGLRSDLSRTSTLISARIALILHRYASTAPMVKARTFMQKNLIEPGEVISLTSALLPNRYTGARGITAGLFEVIHRSIVFDQGYVDFELLWTSWSLLSKDDFNRADSAATDYLLGNTWNKSEADPGALRVISNELYLGDGVDVFGGHGFMIRPETFGANQTSELEFVSASAGISGPAVRQDSTGGFANYTGIAALYDPANTEITLRTFVNVSLPSGALGTELGSYTVTLVAGDTVRLHANGSALKVYVNNALVIDVDTVVPLGGGDGPGALTNKATGSITWDNWRGGNDGWA